MNFFTIRKITEMLGAHLSSQSLPALIKQSDRLCHGFSFDSRRLRKGELFIALKTKTNDGHQYLEEVIAKGACAALVNKDHPQVKQLLSQSPQDIFFLLPVADPLDSLQLLATAYRNILKATVIAVTGSNGKTSVCHTLSRLLKDLVGEDQVCSSTRSFNNHLGVPLTILSAEVNQRFLIVEMGMNHRGEIQALSKIAQPDHAIITNVSQAHGAFFANLNEIAEAKLEIVEGLKIRAKKNQQRTLNSNSSLGYHLFSLGLAKAEQLCQKNNIALNLHAADKGLNHLSIKIEELKNQENCTVLKFISYTNQGILFAYRGKQILARQLFSKVQLTNLAAIINLLSRLGFQETEILGKIEKFNFSHVAGRFQVHHLLGSRILVDDSYNANPTSFAASLANLREMKKGKKLALFAGEMKELGSLAKPAHQEIAEKAAQLEYSLFAASGGQLAKIMKKKFEQRNPDALAFYAPDPLALYNLVEENISLDNYDGILVKGSRAAHMELIVERIIAHA